jgi:aerobic-type carbon monoxide dehydrogenase small subunit (CoxS/CutS family)
VTLRDPSTLALAERPEDAPVLDPTRARRLCLVSLTLNGEPVTVAVPSHWTLLELLRYGLGLTGTKQGCDKGDCGTCTVRVDGEPNLSCITLALQAQGRFVETVEGLGVGGDPHPLQAAFARCGAAQCGFCTPGMLMSASAYLDRVAMDEAELSRQGIAEAIGGNLCRCTGYTKILEAIEQAGQEMLGHSQAVSEADMGSLGMAEETR